MEIESTIPEEITEELQAESEKDEVEEADSGLDIQFYETGPNLLKEKEKSLWGKIKQKVEELKSDFTPIDWNNVWNYFRAQVLIRDGERLEARIVYEDVIENTGFEKFEENNVNLLAAIDIAVRGKSHREDGFKNPIEPLFEIED